MKEIIFLVLKILFRERIQDVYRRVQDWVVQAIGKVHWGFSNGLNQAEKDRIKELLKPNYYIILTHRNNHLSTWFTALATLVLTGKWGYWAHALMNLENDVDKTADFMLVEATGPGVHYSTFDEVFEVHGVTLLKPRNMSIEHWTYVMDKARTELGKPYDTLFDLTSDKALSCVELVRAALQAEPNYETDFAEFERMIAQRKYLAPDMFYECSDFEVVYEVRRL